MRTLKRCAVVVLLTGFAPMAGAAVDDLQARIITVFEQAAPAVVNITVRGTVEDRFMRPVPVEGSGSGFLFDGLGHIVTNFHVVDGANQITVAFQNVDCCVAEVVGVDPSTDLAVLRVRRTVLPTPLELADSDALKVGQFVVAIGNPFGLSSTMSFGIISALERVIRSPNGRFVGGAIQTDAAINPGNSGGPLLDLDGKVIGVNSQIISPVRASAGVGFAVPANTVRRVVTQLIATGRYAHPYLGFDGFGPTPEVVQFFRLAGLPVPVDRGVLVTSVDPGGPAERAGLRAGTELLRVGSFVVAVGGDVVLGIDGRPVNSLVELMLYLDNAKAVGDTVILDVLRDGVELQLEVEVVERPDDLSLGATLGVRSCSVRLGVHQQPCSRSG